MSFRRHLLADTLPESDNPYDVPQPEVLAKFPAPLQRRIIRLGIKWRGPLFYKLDKYPSTNNDAQAEEVISNAERLAVCGELFEWLEKKGYRYIERDKQHVADQYLDKIFDISEAYASLAEAKLDDLATCEKLLKYANCQGIADICGILRQPTSENNYNCEKIKAYAAKHGDVAHESPEIKLTENDHVLLVKDLLDTKGKTSACPDTNKILHAINNLREIKADCDQLPFDQYECLIQTFVLLQKLGIGNLANYKRVVDKIEHVSGIRRMLDIYLTALTEPYKPLAIKPSDAQACFEKILKNAPYTEHMANGMDLMHRDSISPQFLVEREKMLESYDRVLQCGSDMQHIVVSLNILAKKWVRDTRRNFDTLFAHRKFSVEIVTLLGPRAATITSGEFDSVINYLPEFTDKKDRKTMLAFLMGEKHPEKESPLKSFYGNKDHYTADVLPIIFSFFRRWPEGEKGKNAQATSDVAPQADTASLQQTEPNKQPQL